MIQINGWRVTMTKDDLDELNGEIQIREDEANRLEQQLDDCRKYLAKSVAKECKCETNATVNNDMVDRNLKLQRQLKELQSRYDGAIEQLKVQSVRLELT